MDTLANADLMADEDKAITATVLRERSRLGSFIRRRVPDPTEAEDVLQDVFEEFVEAWRLPGPIEHVSAWLFQVARNRIIDRFRKKKTEEALDEGGGLGEDDEGLALELMLPASDAGPAAAYARTVLIEALEDALGELPEQQREVFVAHELEGMSFKQMSARLGVGINTLLARKRYAVLNLRARLQAVYDDLDD